MYDVLKIVQLVFGLKQNVRLRKYDSIDTWFVNVIVTVSMFFK